MARSVAKYSVMSNIIPKDFLDGVRANGAYDRFLRSFGNFVELLDERIDGNVVERSDKEAEP